MATDSRTPVNDATATLGTIITPNEKRDAIHLAVEPVIAAHRMRAGDRVGLRVDGRATSVGVTLLGIVDPFLDAVVNEGDRFWLIVYPRQITSLRHVWEHPSFQALAAPQAVKPQNRRSLPPPVKAAPRAVAAVVPEFEESPEKDYTDRDIELSWAAIAKIADSIGESSEELLGAAWNWKCGGEYWSKPKFEGERVPDEFWTHYEVVTGETVKEEGRRSFLTCSC